MIKRTMFVGLVAAVLSSQVLAVTVYTDRTSWENAVSGFVTEDFNAQTPFDFVPGSSDVGLFNIDLTGGSGDANSLAGPTEFIGQFAIDGTNHIVGQVLQGGLTHPTYEFPVPIIGFGADWRSTNDGGLLTVTLDGMTIEFDNFLSPGGIGFLGFVADNPFTQAQFDTETTDAEAFGMDNLSFAAVGGNAIPEPITATLGLMGLGVLGIATRRRVA